MKKLLLLLAFCGSMFTANAQREAGALTLKPMVGMTIANVTDNDGGDSKIGLAAGAELEYQASDKFSITGGAVYSMQGAKYSGMKLKLEYINIPILANYYITKGLAIKAGIQPGFKVSNKAESEGVEVNLDTYGLEAKSIDFSIPVGISYEISDFVIDARYQWGLTKIYEGSDSKNSVFMISVGYKFDL